MCGLYGRLSKEKKIDMLAFNVLGVANDVRGGDSCGYFIDGKSAYGHEQTKLYENFFKTDEGLKTITTARIAIGHDRKASVGGVSLDKAQPVIITNDDDPSLVDFVLIHNGTINNHKELAKKYLEIGEKDSYSDSQIMAYIIYYHGFEVLQEYVGAGAFVMVDYRQNRETPTAYIFKGESAQNYSGKPQEERPLFLAMKPNEIWFSSLRAPLELITWNKNYKIIDLKTNVLFTIQDGTIIDEMEYDRTKIEYKSFYASTNHAVTPYRRDYNGYGDDDDYESFYGAYSKHANTKKQNVGSQFAALHYNRKMGEVDYHADPYGKRNIKIDRIADESKLYNGNFAAQDRVIFNSLENRYYLHSIPVDGLKRCSRSGYITTANPESSYNTDIFFFEGVIIKTRAAYEFLCQLCVKLDVTHKYFYEHFEPIVWAMSVSPRYDDTLNILQKHIIAKDDNNNITIQCKAFSGLLPIVFLQTDKVYTVNKGSIESYVNVYTNNEFFVDYSAHVEDPYDYKEILDFFSSNLAKLTNDTKAN